MTQYASNWYMGDDGINKPKGSSYYSYDSNQHILPRRIDSLGTESTNTNPTSNNEQGMKEVLLMRPSDASTTHNISSNNMLNNKCCSSYYYTCHCCYCCYCCHCCHCCNCCCSCNWKKLIENIFFNRINCC